MLKHLSRFLAISALVALGCGDDGGGGGGADAGDSVDAAPQPDAAPSVGACGIVVDLTELDYKGPSGVTGGPSKGTAEPTLTVVFSGPDGELLTSMALAEGQASYDSCVQGTMITLVESYSIKEDDRATLLTYAGVNPGDTVYLGARPDTPEKHALVNVTTPSDAEGFDIDGADLYACGTSFSVPGPSTSVEFDLDATQDGCPLNNGNIDLILVAYDDYGDIIASSRLNAAVTLGSPGDDAYTYLTMPDLQAEDGPLPNANVITNIPPNTGYGTSETATVVGPVFFGNQDRGTSGIEFSSFDPSATATFRGFPADWAERQISLTYGRRSGFVTARGLGGGNGEPDVSIFQHAMVVPFTETVETDLSQALPYITSVVTTRMDSARPQYNWLTAAPVGEADLVAGLMGYQGMFQAGSWLFVAPAGGASSFKVPALPEALTGFAPRPASQVLPAFTVILDTSFASYTDIVTNESFNPWRLFFEEGWPCDSDSDLAGGLGLTGVPPGAVSIRRSVACQDD